MADRNLSRTSITNLYKIHSVYISIRFLDISFCLTDATITFVAILRFVFRRIVQKPLGIEAALKIHSVRE